MLSAKWRQVCLGLNVLNWMAVVWGAWNRLARHEIWPTNSPIEPNAIYHPEYPQTLPIVSCAMFDLFWKFHENQLGTSVMLLTDGQTDRRTDGRTDRPRDRQRNRDAYGPTDGQPDGRTGKQTGRQEGREADTRIDGLTDRQTSKQINKAQMHIWKLNFAVRRGKHVSKLYDFIRSLEYQSLMLPPR